MQIGLFDIPLDELPLAAETGTDLVHWYGLQYCDPNMVVRKEFFTKKYQDYTIYMDQAYSLGMKVMVEVPRIVFAPVRPEPYERKMFFRRVTRHPAFHSWYLADEPEINRNVYRKWDDVSLDGVYAEVSSIQSIVTGSMSTNTRIATLYYHKHLPICSPYWTDQYMLSLYTLRKHWWGDWLSIRWAPLLWKLMALRYGTESIIPIIQTHDITRFDMPFDTKSYREPTTEEMSYWVDRAKAIGFPEVWFWGFHADDMGKTLYTLTDPNRLEQAKTLIARAKGCAT